VEGTICNLAGHGSELVLGGKKPCSWGRSKDAGKRIRSPGRRAENFSPKINRIIDDDRSEKGLTKRLTSLKDVQPFLR